jgi:hypothetical protein
MEDLKLLVAEYEKAKATQKRMSKLMVFDANAKPHYFTAKENKKYHLKLIIKTIKKS